MGIKTSKADKLPFNIHQYQILPHNGPPNCKILRHIHTNKEMQEYTIQFNDLEQFQQYKDAFYWRLNQPYVVQTLHFVDNNNFEFCSTAYGAFMYSQRIPLRLSDIQDIPYPDNLHILHACMQGYSTLYPKTGYFDILETFICFNMQAQAKVWINSDLSLNFPESNTPQMAQDNEKQLQMVQKIIDLINSNTDQNSETHSFQRFFRQNEVVNFAQAKLLLKQFCKLHNIKIPTVFESIQQHLNGQFNSNEMSSKSSSQIKKNSHLQIISSKNQNPIDEKFNQSNNQIYMLNSVPYQVSNPVSMPTKPQVYFNYYNHNLQTTNPSYYSNYHQKKPILQHHYLQSTYPYPPNIYRNDIQYLNYSIPQIMGRRLNEIYPGISNQIIYQQQAQSSYSQTQQHIKKNTLIQNNRIKNINKVKSNNILANHFRNQLHSSQIVLKNKNNNLNQSNSHRNFLSKNVQLPLPHLKNNQFQNVRNKKAQIVKSAKQIIDRKNNYQNQENPRRTQQKFQETLLYHSLQDEHELDPEIVADLLNMEYV